MAGSEDDHPIFKDVRYYAIGVLDDQIEKLLSNGKAKQERYLSGLATHAIVTDYSNLEVEEARDVWQIPAVTGKWVELSDKCKKLLPTEAFTPSNSQIFSGLVFCPSQLKKEDINLLWALATFYGGSCQLTLNKSCTHLVVPIPNGLKYEEASKHAESISTVTLDWILDSVRNKVLQVVKNYHPSLVVLPKAKPDVVETIVPDTQGSEPDIIASSLQSLAVSAAAEQTTNILSQNATTASVQMQQPSLTSMSQQAIPVAIKGSIGHSVISSSQSQMLSPQTGMAVMQSDKGEIHHHLGQTIISQTGQQYILTGQSIGQPQMMTLQQFQMQQRPATSSSSTRFPVQTLQQKFPSPTQPSPGQRQPTPKKTPQKRRRSSAKSKANAAASTAPVPSSPILTNQMTLMSQQQFLQQQNQQMLMNQHRMTMMQQQAGQGTKVNFMQPQQMYQTQHFANMQGKPQVPPSSPQKQPQHMMAEQVQGGMRPFLQGSYPANAMRMQQLQQRPMQLQTPLSPQQMMAMGLNPQMQFQQQQQVKMPGMGQQQQPQTQFTQQPQQGVIIQRGMQMQTQPPGMNTGKMQPQRMQVSPQQQGMFMQQHVTNEVVSSRQPMQQHSPMKQQAQTVPQQQTQPQMQTPMTPQHRQQQLIMQQMAHQRQLQMQLMQTSGQMPTQQQKQTAPPVSHAPINVGIGVISPTALQQGLMIAQAQQNQGFQAPLIHPSLQTPQDYGKVTHQSSGTKSRRSKSRKPKDGDENAEGKPKAKSRSRPKKSTQSSASSSSSPGGKKLSRNSPAMSGIGGYYQTALNVMTPPPHPTVPVAFSKQSYINPTATVSPLAAAENTSTPTHVLQNNAPRMEQSPQPSLNETRYLSQHTPAHTPPPPPLHRGPFNDPLEVVPVSYAGKYYGHDPAENVPQDLCLLGCVFVIIEYQDTVPDLKVVGYWKRVINKFGGIVEEEYNTCTCTHILCISQSTTLFKDALLEGKRCVTIYWLNDVLQIRKLRPPWLAIHIPTPYPAMQKPATHHTISYTGFHQKERERLRMMASVSGCKFSGYLSRSNTVLVCKGTLSLKYEKAREWRIPCVSVHWLRDVLHGNTEALNDPGQSNYQNFDEKSSDLFSLDEMRAQKILDPWKVPVRVTLDCMQRARVKRKKSISDNSAAPALKRSRIEGSYQPLPRVCFTGLPTKQVAELQRTLESLQGQTSKTISLSTHLVAKCVSRTVKFLCAISVCQYIVTPEWIEDSGRSNWLLDEDKYLLHDKNTEEKFNFSLKESLRRARSSPLFKGHVFCITENVAPDRKILREIIECAGGKVIEKIPATSVLKRVQSRKVPNNHLLLVSCPADKEQVIQWKEEGISVHNAEIILSGVLKQEVNETLYQL